MKQGRKVRRHFSEFGCGFEMPLRRERVPDEPVYEPDNYEWITEPTAKCDSDDCYNWFAIDRKTCPLCSTVRGSRKRRKA